MRELTNVLGFVFLSILSLSASDKAKKSSVSLSTDELAIYRAVLRQYTSNETASLNVAAQTYPLDASFPLSGLSNAECLKGIQLENLSTVSSSFHDLPPGILVSKEMKLVDSKEQSKIVRANDPSVTIRAGTPVDNAVNNAIFTGLFSMSEIAFDKTRQFAVVSFSFWCGALCGHGSTLIFQKVGKDWKQTDRNCGAWIS